MKRKRFLKLVMSYGVQRNEAERLAKMVCVYGSYEAVFAHYRLYLEGRCATMGIRKVYASIVRALRPVVKSIREFFSGIDWAALLAAEDEGGEEAAETEE